ncbi:hypothetical protein [Rubellimicrobium roseum]|uniref:Uncharacterized protein n=1 Tax=Rubellimicrobium roseum TaxID=687525 RepID=A0A5C4N6F7_9RHOB|nr:hypothetical protein [Rubellimicrobium roseum]TNC60674.1 hypothetical protein FHG71_21890 [Rubellimicrobium roseum]
MTTKAQMAANQRNSEASSGPRTPQGRATAARNARRHGATGAPSPTTVADWYRVITDNPRALPSDLLRSDAETSLALALADAEARLCAAAAALDVHRTDPLAKFRDLQLDSMFEEVAETLRLEAAEFGPTKKRLNTLTQLAKRKARFESKMQNGADKEGRLLHRYLREAQSRRDRAFSDWIAHLSERRSLSPNQGAAWSEARDPV